jgi:hypothetical protein
VGAPDGTNQYAQIAIPAANGAGAALDVSAFGSFKSIILGGTGSSPLEGTITVQAKGPTGGFVPLVTFDRGGVKTIEDVVADEVRAYARGFAGTIPGTLRMDIGALDD